jgi:hypothetical protein
MKIEPNASLRCGLMDDGWHLHVITEIYSYRAELSPSTLL